MDSQGECSGVFPHTGGVFPFRREDELPVRMFAERAVPRERIRDIIFFPRIKTSTSLSGFRLPSLYGNDPQERLDIFGKVCESGSA